MLLQFLINGIITGTLYGLIALGFAMVYNTTRIFHIAYAAIYMAAPYFLLLFLNILGWAFWPSVFMAIIATIILGMASDFLVYSPLLKRNSSSNVIMVASIGLMIIIINLIAIFFGNETKIINPSISKSITFGQMLVTHTQLYQFFMAGFIIVLFFVFLKFSRFGIRTRAFRDDSRLCSVLGNNTIRYRHIFFILSSFFAAAGSCLIAYDVGMNPYVGMSMLLNAVVALIIGGVGRFHAPILGGIMLGVMQALVVYAASARWQDAVTFTLLILFLLLRPQGILGEKTRTV